MEFEVGQILENWEVEKYAMDLHYQTWDTQGREESNIPSRVQEVLKYKLCLINIDKINEPSCYLDDKLIEEYSELSIDTMPPIVLDKEIDNKYEIIDGNHRFQSCIMKGLNTVLAFVPVI